MHLALNRAQALGMIVLLALAIVAAGLLVSSPATRVTEVGAASSDFAGAHGSGVCLYSTLGGWKCFG